MPWLESRVSILFGDVGGLSAGSVTPCDQDGRSRKKLRILGGRYLFLPLTLVGLENIDEEDQGKVTVNPFAIQEPLFWLMHMSGYPVF